MLNALIRFSIDRRGWVLVAAAALLYQGIRSASRLSVDVLPELTRPSVTVLTEAPGFAPEEVERFVTLPLENSLAGLVGVRRVRSTSDASLSYIQAEFDWGTDTQRMRTLVRERLGAAEGSLPDGVQPHLTPETSLLGNILLIGLTAPGGEMDPLSLREYADGVLARQISAIPGVSEVLSSGGGIRQIEVRPDLHRMVAHGVEPDDLRNALSAVTARVSGGFRQQDGVETLFRLLDGAVSPARVADTVVRGGDEARVRVGDVADVRWAALPGRGDAGIAAHELGTARAFPGVILSVIKAPGFDTLRLTRAVENMFESGDHPLPEGVRLLTLYRQADFISLSMRNLTDALRDGGLVVALILLLFMGNPKVALIALSAIPMSLGITFLVFDWLGATLNTMTLGGLAVAIGMVVDDAIVDVENTYRRMRENAALPNPLSKGDLIYKASLEVRSSILYAALSIVLVFLPLLALEGIEGRLFTPIAQATLLSMASAFLVSMTLTNALAYVLLHPRPGLPPRDNLLLRGLKRLFQATWLRVCLAAPLTLSGLCLALLLWALHAHQGMGDNFLPRFQEPSAVIATTSAPGTSLAQTTETAHAMATEILAVPGVSHVGFRAGRAERDDHIVPVSTVEFEISFQDPPRRPQADILAEVRTRLQDFPGTFSAVSAPLADRIGHMLSGVADPVAVKISGPDLAVLDRLGQQLLTIARGLPGLAEARLEIQTPLPQLHIEVDPERAALHNLRPGEVLQNLGGLLAGETLLELPREGNPIPLTLRLGDEWATDPALLASLPLRGGDGAHLTLGEIADIVPARGPGLIRREHGRRRLALTAKTVGDDPIGTVNELRRRAEAELVLPPGYSLRFEGDFEARVSATRTMRWTSLLAFLLITALLLNYFRSWKLTFLTLLNVPVALTGGVLLTRFTLNTVSIATLVGYIAVGGVALRNAIMMVSHFLHLLRHEGEKMDLAMVRRGAVERLSPVLMSALTTGCALLPLVFADGQSGKELLHPVAIVMVGGLASSTLLGLGLTPSLFYHFCRTSAEKSIRRDAPATA